MSRFDANAFAHTRPSKDALVVIQDDPLGLDGWDQCVKSLMGPRIIEGDDAKRRACALRLAYAALIFAGETALADEVHERIEDLGSVE